MNNKNNSRYEELANQIPELIAGVNNVSYFTHCMTRLRFTLKETTNVDAEKVRKLPGVKGVQWSGDQLQVIIGQTVDEAYAAICRKTGLGSQVSASEGGTAPRKKNFFSDVSCRCDIWLHGAGSAGSDWRRYAESSHAGA